MAKFDVLDMSGKKVESIELSDGVFGIEPNVSAMHADVVNYLANQRQGTHKSKQRNEISGSTRKLKKQKGTGGARAGSIKNPLFRGGGRVFGPVPRDYSFKLNKKLKRLARRSALSLKVGANAVTVVEDFNFEAPKTKQIIQLIKDLQVNSRNLLFVTNGNNDNVVLSARNLQDVSVMRVSDLATYDIMRARHLVFVESSVEGLNEMFNLNNEE